MKKIIAAALCTIIALCASGCNKYGEYSEHTGTVYQTQAQPTNNVEVSFVSAKTYRAAWDDDYLLVTLNVTNNTGAKGNCLVYLEAFQNDIPLDIQNYGTLDSEYDSDNLKKYIDSGSSAEITYAFILKNKSDDVNIDIYNTKTNKKIAIKTITFN